MTLSQLFAQINANYNTVEALSNSIYTPYKSDIDQYWREADYYSKSARYWIYTDWQYFNSAIYNYTRNIVWLLEDFIDEMYLTTGSVEANLQSIFNTYMDAVVYDVQRSVELVQTQMYNEVDFLTANVDVALFDLQDYLDTEVNAMHAQIDLLSIDVISWIDAAVADLADTLNLRIEEVNTNLTARVDFIETWTAETIQAVYDYVDILNTEMMTYINDANATLYVYINNRVKELDDYIGVIHNTLNLRITTEVNNLTDEIAAIEITLTDRIKSLESQTNWNFTFFDLFTSRPELSLLQVLLRSNAEFDYYKPYWQALFARVLAED